MGKYTNHIIYTNMNKEEVPSVTTIIQILNKPSLQSWANYLGFKRKNVKAVLDESARRGTLVHQLLNAYAFNKYYMYIPCQEISKQELSSILFRFDEWKKEYEFEPIFGEKKFSTDKYGGTVDMYCKINGKYTILDFKTSKGFYSTMFIQLSAYYMLLKEQEFPVEQVAILLVNSVKCEIKIIDVSELDKYCRLFNLLVDAYYEIYDLNKEWKDLLKGV